MSDFSPTFVEILTVLHPCGCKLQGARVATYGWGEWDCEAGWVRRRANTGDNHYLVPPHTPVIICGEPGDTVSLPLKDNNNTTTTHTTGYYSLAPVPVTDDGDWLAGFLYVRPL